MNSYDFSSYVIVLKHTIVCKFKTVLFNALYYCVRCNSEFCILKKCVAHAYTVGQFTYTVYLDIFIYLMVLFLIFCHWIFILHISFSSSYLTLILTIIPYYRHFSAHIISACSKWNFVTVSALSFHVPFQCRMFLNTYGSGLDSGSFCIFTCKHERTREENLPSIIKSSLTTRWYCGLRPFMYNLCSELSVDVNSNSLVTAFFYLQYLCVISCPNEHSFITLV